MSGVIAFKKDRDGVVSLDCYWADGGSLRLATAARSTDAPLHKLRVSELPTETDLGFRVLTVADAEGPLCGIGLPIEVNGEQIDSFGSVLDVATKRALRVPSLVPGKWVYLRVWSCYGSGPELGSERWGERSHGCSIHVVSASSDIDSRIIVDGIEPMRITHQGSFEANQRAVDAYLFSLGAEIVPSEEWPANSDGVGPRETDRTPYRTDPDLPPYHDALVSLGYTTWASRLEPNKTWSPS